MPCRRDYRDLTSIERDRLVAALYDAKSRGVVDDYASQHETYFHDAHHSSFFLPWHREFLRRFEIELRSYDSRVTLPFWDWRNDRSTSATLWDDGFLGGFDSDWSLGRSLGSAGDLATDGEVATTLGLTPYGTFWPILETDIHDGVHVWVGGVMVTAASPGDPVFFLHHCTIDMYWAQWQVANPAEPYQSSGAGRGLNDAMAPWTTTPADVLDHRAINTYAYPSGFIRDAAIVIPETTTVLFLDVPEGLFSYRAAVFDVSSCGTTELQADPPVVLTGPAGASFGLMNPLVPVNPEADPKGRVWVTYQGTADGDSATGEVTIRGPELGQQWTIPITANTVRRPTAAAALVLDQSNSMTFDSGIGSLTRADVLRFSAPPFVDVLEDGNAAAVCTFDHDAHPSIGVTPVAGGGDALVNGAIAGYAPNTEGWTSIGEGVAFAHGLLQPVSADYDVRAIVVMTDGRENHGPHTRRYIADVTDLIDEHVFAIGLGTADALNPAALAALCDGHDGYLLLTGALGTDAYFRLSKYYQQILAGVTSNEIVLDPEGSLLPGQTHRIPFWLSDADVTATAVLLTPAPYMISMALETPDGTLIDGGFAGGSAAVEVDAGDDVVFYRTLLPLPIAGGEAHAGLWHAVLELERKYEVPRYMVAAAVAPSAYGAALSHGLRYSLSVHAFSGVRLQAHVGQTSFEPGATLNLRALLSESGLPISGAHASVELQRPDGSLALVQLAASDPGMYEAAVPAGAAGIYQLRFLADGATLRGRPFTREQLRTAAVWRGGDRPPPTADDDRPGRDQVLCRVLLCLLRQEGLVASLARAGVDVRALRKCLGEVCAEQRRPRWAASRGAGLEVRLRELLGDEVATSLLDEATLSETEQAEWPHAR